MPNCGPNEDSEDFDFEKWAVNEGSGQSVEVRRGSKQHQEAWLAFHNRKTFVLASDKNTVEFFTQRNWIPQPYKEYIQFNPPVDWDKE